MFRQPAEIQLLYLQLNQLILKAGPTSADASDACLGCQISRRSPYLLRFVFLPLLHANQRALGPGMLQHTCFIMAVLKSLVDKCTEQTGVIQNIVNQPRPFHAGSDLINITSIACLVSTQGYLCSCSPRPSIFSLAHKRGETVVLCKIQIIQGFGTQSFLSEPAPLLRKWKSTFLL